MATHPLIIIDVLNYYMTSEVTASPLPHLQLTLKGPHYAKFSSGEWHSPEMTKFLGLLHYLATFFRKKKFSSVLEISHFVMSQRADVTNTSPRLVPCVHSALWDDLTAISFLCPSKKRYNKVSVFTKSLELHTLFCFVLLLLQAAINRGLNMLIYHVSHAPQKYKDEK